MSVSGRKPACLLYTRGTMEYSAQQLEIINTPHRRILVNSVAGSGKTTTIRAVINKELSCGVSPDNIMICTFTRKMARELKLINSRIKWCDTIHGIAARIVEKYKNRIGYGDVILIDDVEDNEIIRKTISRNALKITFTRAEELIREYCNTGNVPMAKKKEELFIRIYLRELRNADMITYNLLEYYANAVLDQVPEFGFDVVVVDEYQDTSVLENALINKLAKNKLVAVGDVMQSIYAFRGTTIDNMLNLPVDHEHNMSTTYRVPGNISEYANTLIEKNDFGYNLVMDSKKDGGVLDIVNDIRTETIDAKLRELLKMYAPQDIYVLTRTNRQISYLVETLVDLPIDKELSSVKNMKYLDYLNIACRAYYNGYYNYGMIRLLRLFDYRDKDLMAMELSGKRIYDFVKNNPEIREFNNVMNSSTPFIDKARTILPMFEKRRGEYDTMMVKVLPYIEYIETPIDYMEWYDTASSADFMPPDKIAIITCHMAKGMENKAIVIPYVEEGTFPNSRASYQEELRLFYVAVTRAMEHLVILHNDSVFVR